jgi:hypothetical protein
VKRVISNGFSVGALVHMINRFREAPVEITNMGLVRKMQISMRANPQTKDWTITGARAVPLENWDSSSLSTRGYKPPRITHPCKEFNAVKRNAKPDSIPFKDLCKLVKERPTGEDAFDLSRCINYHLAHPNEQWLCPDDFEKLIMRIGGPLPITVEHTDPESGKRWAIRASVASIHARGLTGNEKEAAMANLGKSFGRRRVDRYAEIEVARPEALSRRPAQPATAPSSTAPAPANLDTTPPINLDATASVKVNITGSSDPDIPALTNPLDIEIANCFAAASANLHVSAPANSNTAASITPHIPPPPIAYQEFTQIINSSSHGGGRIILPLTVEYGTALTRDPYQFDGPRVSPPFRFLHLLGDLRDDDVSDWAENIRWVKFKGLTCLCEDPTTLNFIKQRRLDELWASWQFIEFGGQWGVGLPILRQA